MKNSLIPSGMQKYSDLFLVKDTLWALGYVEYCPLIENKGELQCESVYSSIGQGHSVLSVRKRTKKYDATYTK